MKHALIARSAIVRCCAGAALASLLATTSFARADDLPSGQRVYSMALNAMHDTPMAKYASYDLSYVVHGLQLTLFCSQDGSHRFLGSSVSIAPNEKSNTGKVAYDSTTGLGVLTANGRTVMECVPFPFAPEVRALTHPGDGTPSPAPIATPASDAPIDVMKSIGSVRAFSSKSYSIENAGIEPVDDNPAYHLKMTAVEDPSTHPLTDVYVDVATHRVRSVVLGGGKRGLFTGGGGFARFDFRSFGGAWLVHSIHIEASGHMLVVHASGTLDYTLDNYTFPATLPKPS